MNDDLAELERVLTNKAAEVPHFQRVPQRMLRRARRRVVRNALSAVVAAGFVVFAVSVGLAGLRAPGAEGPAHRPEPITSCTAAELRATAALNGAAGSVVGAIDVTNFGARTCTLQGRARLSLFSSGGHALAVQRVNVPAQWRVDGARAPSGWPVVRLPPGSVAAIRVRWTNPCPQLGQPASWNVELASGGGRLDVFGTDGTFPPPCLGSSQPSTLEVGPFEPGGRG